MASTSHCLASLARLSISAPPRPTIRTLPRFLVPSLASGVINGSRGFAAKRGTNIISPKEKAERDARRAKLAKKKRRFKDFRVPDLNKLDQFTLCDAMRYVRAYEVGRDPIASKYDIAIRLRTARNGAVVRGRLRLPHPVGGDVRVAVICKDGGTVAMEARSLGAVAVGETEVFAMIREGRMNFDRLICHTDSEQALQRAGLGRILGPKGLMPSAKTNTVSSDIKGLMQDMLGAEAYRERDATIRLRVGQVGFTPQMLADNVKAVMNRIKDDIAKLEDTIEKAIHEVVLSSTNSPGFSLNGAFKSEDPAAAPEKLAGAM